MMSASIKRSAGPTASSENCVQCIQPGQPCHGAGQLARPVGHAGEPAAFAEVNFDAALVVLPHRVRRLVEHQHVWEPT